MPKSKRRKPKSENMDLKSIIIKTLVGSAISVFVYFILTAVCSLICLKLDTKQEAYIYIIYAISAVSGFVGGYRAVSLIRKNGLIIGAVCALPALVIIFLVSSIIGRTGMSASGWIVAVIMAVFSAVGGVLSANRRR